MRFSRVILVLSSLFLVAAATASATPNGPASRTDVPIAPAFSPFQLASPAADDWITNGGNITNNRYSSLSQINTSNVANLKEAWHVHLDGSGMKAKYSAEATPLVYQGVMYIPTGNSDVFAINAATGERIWTHLSGMEQTINTACCGWDNRGVALGDGMVFVAQLDGQLVALDQKTGGVVWARIVHNWREGFTLTSAPLYYNGLVYVGSTGGEYMSRGSITAYNAKNGNFAWRFFSAPAPGEIGGQTWAPGPLGFSTGGATVWNTPSVDPAQNMIFFSTGNAAPWTSRGPGLNLFTSSVVALDATTGQIRWWYQQVHHDLWDYDCPNATILFDTEIGGVLRHGLAEACKTGWLYLLDRTNGKPLLPIPEVKVPQSKEQHTWPTQPVPVGDRIDPMTCAKKATYKKKFAGKPQKVGCIWDPPTIKHAVAVAPSAQGGVDWNPSAYNPDTHYFYACAADSDFGILALPAATINRQYLAGRAAFGVQFSGIKFYAGYIAAMDVTTNKAAWRVKWPLTCYSGIFTTAGGLVFAGRNTGDFYAYDAKTGQQLWTTKLASNVAAPGMSYAVNGKQYIAIYDGGTAFTFEAPGKHGDDLYAFTLP